MDSNKHCVWENVFNYCVCVCAPMHTHTSREISDLELILHRHPSLYRLIPAKAE
uniref:Unnamed protein product n=1 Tax=Macaca fascicularis TaxID=9541 RepID=Q9N064_MACFA|nr:unnamed protein product [Macaca fascicularis]